MGELFVTLIIIVIIIVLATRTKGSSSYNYGSREERRVNSVLARLAKRFGGVEFLDMMFEYNGHTTQIDNMLLTKKALYIIETKDYSGWIFGSERNQYWTQVFRHYKARTSGNNYTNSGTSKYKFYNPILQNNTHVNMVKRITNIQKLMPVISIICLSTNATLKDITLSGNTHVVYTSELFSLVKNYEESIINGISVSKHIQIVDAINYLNIIDKQKRIEHVRSVQEKHR